MTTMQQRIERRLAIMAKLPPGAPMPGAAARMEAFDSLPREVRQTIANLDRCSPDIFNAAIDAHKRGKAPKAIIKMLETKVAEIIYGSPKGKELVELELKELGL